MLLAAFSKSCGLPGLIASSAVTTVGRELYETSTSSAASFYDEMPGRRDSLARTRTRLMASTVH